MSKQPDIKRFIEFNKLMYRFRAVRRFIHFPGNNEDYENDVEHSYSLAMCAWFLVQYFPQLDRDKVIRFALIHDLAEIYVGDIFSYDKGSRVNKHLLERQALQKLHKEWPDFAELFTDINEYEERKSEEAKFVYALDKLLPAIMNYLGKGHIWHKHKVTIEMFRKEKGEKTAVSAEIYPYYKELLAVVEKHPEYFFIKKATKK